MNQAKKIAEDLLQREAVKISLDPPFTWSSGIKSPVYCDNRKMIAFPEERKMVVEAFKSLIAQKGLKPDVIAGTATAGIPWAAFVAYDLDLPMVYVRPEKKDHGEGKQIEGYLEPGKNVLVIEDLVSTGGSSLRSAQVIREEGQCTVEDLFAIVTYEMAKSKTAFEEANISLATLTDFSTILDVAVERGDIKGEDLEGLLLFREDPPAWAGKMGFV